MTDNDAQAEDVEPQIVDITITAPDAEWLHQHCVMLIEKRLAASANIIPAVESVYRWQGEVCEADEGYAMLRTTVHCVDAVVTLNQRSHPYNVAHILAKPVVGGSEEYLQWVRASVVLGDQGR